MLAKRLFEVPEVLEIHEIPSDEWRMVPELPTTINSLLFCELLFPWLTTQR